LIGEFKMSVSAEKLKMLIEAIVRKEIKTMVPHLVKEAMANLIMETSIGQSYPQARQQINNQQFTGNSHKRVNIQEASGEGYEEYPTLGGKTINAAARYAAIMGGEQFSPVGAQHGIIPQQNPGFITVDRMNSSQEFGEPIPVNPAALPDHLLAAFNTDYRDKMKAMDSKRSAPINMPPVGQGAHLHE
jgi:hypothetical protein